MISRNVGISAADMHAQHHVIGALLTEPEAYQRMEIPFFGSPQLHAQLVEALCNSEFRPTRCSDLSAAAEAPILVCEPRFPEGSWEQALAGLKDRDPAPLVIVVGELDAGVWSTMLNRGVFDVVSDCCSEKLEHILRTAYRRWVHRTENARLRKSAQHLCVTGPDADSTAAL